MIQKSKRSIGEIEQDFKAGDFIVREGDESQELYVIQTGSVEVTKNLNGKDVTLTTMRKGDFFGEMSLLEGTARTATVRALDDTRILVIKPGGLLLRLRRDPTFAFEMLQQLSARIHRMDKALSASNLPSDTIQRITKEAEARGAGEPDDHRD